MSLLDLRQRSNPGNPSPGRPRGPWPLFLRVAAVLFMLMTVALLAGRGWIGGALEKRLDGSLAKAGFTLQRESASWGPWSGLQMSGVKLAREGEAPVMEADKLELHVSLAALVSKGHAGPRLKSKHATVLLRDAHGEIALDDVSLEVESRRGEVVVHYFAARQEGLEAVVSGKVLVAEGSGASGAKDWQPDFNAVRGTLASLKMEGAKERFRVKGKFQVDARNSGPTWSAELHGKGAGVIWHGIPLKKAKARAMLGDRDSKILADLALPRGMAGFTVTREDWKDSPFLFHGTLSDHARRRDEFEGEYQPGARVWTLEHLEGAADLWTLAEDIPVLAARLPQEVSCEVFPKVTLSDVKMSRDAPWQVASLALDGGQLAVKVEEGSVSVSKLRARAAYDGESWRIREAGGNMLGGQLAVSGKLDESKLRTAVVEAENLKLAAVRDAVGQKGDTDGMLSFRYHGSLDFGKGTAQGKGTMQLDNAPVFSVPLLDETFQLFSGVLAGIERPKTGRFEAVFIAMPGVVEVPRFEATGGSLNVSAKGEVDLARKRVDGVARGKLTGLPGVVTKPLSRLLEMEVGGPYDNIRVKPMGPAKLVSNAASGTVGVPVDALEEAGKVTGTVLVEGIKMPFRLMEREGEARE
jgi:hypothetical protein